VNQTIPPSSRVQDILGTLAGFAFFATLVFMPLRWRSVLLARPNGTVYADYTDFLLFLPDIALTATLLLWGLARWTRRDPLQFGPAYIWVPLAGLTVTGALSVVVSVDRALSLYHTIRLALLFLFYLYLVNEPIFLPMIGAAIGLQGALQAEVAITQSILQRSVGLQAFGEYELDPLWSGISIVSDGTTRFLRAYGLSDHPNILGGCLAFGLAVLLAAYLRGGWKNSVALAILFAWLCAALLLTFSRAAWLAFFAGAGLMLGMDAWAYRSQNLKPVLLLALGMSLVVSPFIAANSQYLGARLNVGNSFENNPAEKLSIVGRAFLNESANRIFVKYPLTGVGLSASPVAMKNEYPEFPMNYQPPHFALLVVALETGIFGAAFYFLLMALPWIVLLRRRQMWSNPNVIGAAGLLLAVTVVGFFDYYTWSSTPGRLWQWLAWGLFAAAMESSLIPVPSTAGGRESASPIGVERGASGNEAGRRARGEEVPPLPSGEGRGGGGSI